MASSPPESSEESDENPQDLQLLVGERRQERFWNETAVEAAGFTPVYERSDVPDQLRMQVEEKFGEPTQTNVNYFIGSNRSIFYKFGYDEIIDIIDNPLYALSEEPVRTMARLQGGDLLFEEYAAYGLLPWDLVEKLSVYPPPLHSPPDWRQQGQPKEATPTGQRVDAHCCDYGFASLFPRSRSGLLPSSVKGVSVKNDRRGGVTLRHVQQVLSDNHIEISGILYQGLKSQTYLNALLEFFVPVVHGTTARYDFGSGLYTTPNLEEALKYAGPSGVIVVYRGCDLGDRRDQLYEWRPTEDEWRDVVTPHVKPQQAQQGAVSPRASMMPTSLSDLYLTSTKGVWFIRASSSMFMSVTRLWLRFAVRWQR
ncbi:hypothetical protein KEM56_005258 [Ascosphaera pollenicola]|nr:hypothetical protein KEM56_005258 [Ascosphaera pollenicola]